MTVVTPPRAWRVTHAQQMLLELITICLNLHVAAFVWNSDSLVPRLGFLWILLCRNGPIVPALLSTSRCTHLHVRLCDPREQWHWSLDELGLSEK